MIINYVFTTQTNKYKQILTQAETKQRYSLHVHRCHHHHHYYYLCCFVVAFTVHAAPNNQIVKQLTIQWID